MKTLTSESGKKFRQLSQISQFTFKYGNFEICKLGVLKYQIYDCKMHYWLNDTFLTLDNCMEYLDNTFPLK